MSEVRIYSYKHDGYAYLVALTDKSLFVPFHAVITDDSFIEVSGLDFVRIEGVITKMTRHDNDYAADLIKDYTIWFAENDCGDDDE